jgi:phage shock protein C
MRRSTWNIDNGPLGGLYRDRENGWIFGVCAGVADRFGLNLLAVRVVAVVFLVVFTWLTAAGYLLAAFLLREKPLVYSGRDSEYAFWRRRSNNEWRHS